MGFYMGKPHVIKICMEIYHTNIIWDFPYKLHRHRSCIRWAIDVKMNFCKVLRCAFENNVVSSENTRSAAADDGCRRTRISTRPRHALYCIGGIGGDAIIAFRLCQISDKSRRRL